MIHKKITALSIAGIVSFAVLFFLIARTSVFAAAGASSDEDDFTIVMVGDILMHDGIESCSKREDGTYDYSEIFRHTKSVIEDADLAIVNEEVIIGGKELRITGYPSFNASYELADELADTGFDVICHATNHALDRGKKGIVNCLENWRKTNPDVKVTGIYETEADSKRLCIFEKDGYRIAVLNYTYGTNGIMMPKDMPYAVNILNEKKVRADIEKAGKEADITIVCPHWGTEYSHGISPEQKKWAKVFADCGADIIIGTHPHVIEPVEEITAEDGRKVAVFYSLGNFVNWTSGAGRKIADRMVGAMASVTIAKGEDGNVNVSSYKVMPLVCHVESKTDGASVYFLKDYTQAKSFLNAIRSQDPHFSYEYCEKLCYDIFDESLWR